MSDPRLQQLTDWLAPQAARLGLSTDSLRPASSDASFRRYFRLDAALPGQPSLVVMDAPPPQEDVRPFLHAADALASAGLSVPRVLARDVERGFLLLEDFGGTTYFDALAVTPPDAGPDEGSRATLDPAAAHVLYLDAIDALVRMQAASRPGTFPDYDRALLSRELDLYPDWYVARHRGVTLDDDARNDLEAAFGLLLANNLAQPKVWVHRDWHARNLMLLPGERNPGVLDFQDAVHGPITYDLVSMLRDAYVRWDEERQLDWAIRYWERARKAGLPVATDFGEFWRDMEWMGLQRHLKILGIFARLWHRDGKDRYLADLPLVLRHATDTARRYVALAPLARLIDRIEGSAPAVGYTF